MSPNGCVVLGQRRDPHGGSLRIERASGQRLTRSRIEHKTHGFILARLQVSAHPCDQRLTGFGFQMTREDGDHGDGGDLGRWQASQRKRPVLPRFFLSRFAGVGPISRPVLPRMGKASRRRVGFVKTAIHMGYVPSVPDGPPDGPPMALSPMAPSPMAPSVPDGPMAPRWPTDGPPDGPIANCQLPIANCSTASRLVSSAG